MDDDEEGITAIDFGTFKIDAGVCGEETGFVTLKTPDSFRWEYLDVDIESQRAFESRSRFSSMFTKTAAKGVVELMGNDVIMSIPSFQRANVYAKVLELSYETLKFDRFCYVDQLYLAMYAAGRTSGTLLHAGHRSTSVAAISEGVKLYQSRIQGQTVSSTVPLFSTSSKVLPDGTTFDTFDTYPKCPIRRDADSKQFKRIARLLDNAFKWSTPVSRADVILCGGALRSPVSFLQKQICGELTHISSSKYIDWYKRKVRANILNPSDYYIDFSLRTAQEVRFQKPDKDVGNEVFVGLSICGSLSYFQKYLMVLRHEYEEYGGLGFVSRRNQYKGSQSSISGVMILNKKVQNRFFVNKSGISRVSMKKSTLISLLLCFQRNKYSAQLNLIAHHIGIALLGHPDDALCEDEYVESLWITSKGDTLREDECEKTVKIAQDMILPTKEEKDKQSRVVHNVLKDFENVVMKFPVRNEKNKSYWKTVVDAKNGSVWYLNTKNNDMTYDTPFNDIVVSIGSLFLRTWIAQGKPYHTEDPLVWGSRRFVQNTSMMGCAIPKKQFTKSAISYLGTAHIEHAIGRGHHVDDEMLKEILDHDLSYKLSSRSSLLILSGSNLSIPSRARMRVVDCVFGESCDFSRSSVQKIAMYTPSVLASLAMGCVTSCVFSSGHDASEAVTIFDGQYTPGKHSVPTYVAGRDTTDWLLKQCRNLQYLRTSDRELIRAVKDASSSNEFLILPDGQRFPAQKIQDALFNPMDVMFSSGCCSSKSIGVNEAVRRCVESVTKTSLRNKIVRNIILEGGSTHAGSVSSFESRLEKSLSDLNASVIRTPHDDRDGPRWRAMKGGKIAAEILHSWGNGTDSCGQTVTREEYWEHGPNVFLRKLGWA